jgi:hypothetical protein
MVRLTLGCREPSVATTLTVDELTGEIGPAPQPMHNPNPSAAASAAETRRSPRRFLQPKQQNAAASDPPGPNGLDLPGRVLVVFEAVTVSVDETGAPAGVTLVGEKVHEVPEGNPEQLNETVEAYPFSGVTCTEAEALCPLATVIDAGETTMEKLGAGAWMV